LVLIFLHLLLLIFIFAKDSLATSSCKVRSLVNQEIFSNRHHCLLLMFDHLVTYRKFGTTHRVLYVEVIRVKIQFVDFLNL